MIHIDWLFQGFFTKKGKIMALQDKIAASQQAVTAAQSALDAANAQLASEQAQLAAIQPHLAVYDEIDAFAATQPQEQQDALKALTSKGRALYD
jgi:multidrug resistance efflux pump